MRRLRSVAAVAFLALTLPTMVRAETPSAGREALEKLLNAAPEQDHPTPDEEMKLFGAIYARPPTDNDIIIPWLRRRMDHLQSVFAFELSRRLFPDDRGAALEWFVIGETRFVYDLARCTDSAEGSDVVLATIERSFRPLPEYLWDHPDEHAAALRRAAARHDLFAPETSPTCSDATTPLDQWPSVEERLRARMVKEAEDLEAKRGAPPSR